MFNHGPGPWSTMVGHGVNYTIVNHGRPFNKTWSTMVYLFITNFLSTYIHIQNTHTYATGIGLRLGLSLPSPVGFTVTIHCTNQYIKVTCIIESIYVIQYVEKIQFIGSWCICKIMLKRDKVSL